MPRTHDPVDIVTIGGGFTAAILASKILPETSYRMVSLEQGPAQWTYPDFAHNHDGLRFAKRFAMMHDLSKSTWTWRPNANAPSLPLRQYGFMHPGQGLGGAIVHWSAQLWRFLETDFNYRSHHVERYGAERLPPGTSVQDWPLGYQDLEPYYDAFEYDFGVSGQAGNVLAAVLAALVLAGCGASDEIIGPVGEPSAEVPVGLTEWALAFGDVGPAPGEVTLVVTNAGATAHDLVAEGRHGTWATPILSPGETYELDITVDAGEALHLHCTVPGHHDQGMHVFLMVHNSPG